MASLALSLLGSLQVTLDGDSVPFRSDKERALLSYLAVEADRPHRREALAGLLWGELPEEAALNNLRKTLHRVRQVLSDEESDPPFLLVTPKTIQFQLAARHALDTTTLQQALAHARRHRHRHPETCRACRAWSDPVFRATWNASLSGYKGG